MALQQFRNMTKSPLVIVVLGLVAISLVFLGNPGSQVRGGSNRAVAVVGGEEISIPSFLRQYDNRTRALQEQIGQPISPDMAKQIGLVDQVIGSLVSRAAIEKHARNQGLAASDASVKQELYKNAAFQGVGQRFDPQQYQLVLRQNQFNRVEFETGIRADIVAQQLTETIATGITPPKGLAEMVFRYQAESRGADYILLSPDLVGAIEAPTEDVLNEFHSVNAILFSEPEYRKVTYLSLSPSDFAGSVAVSEDDIAGLYERRKASYTVAETRMVKRLFGSEDDIRSAHARIEGGETFEEVGVSLGFSLQEINLGAIKIDDITDTVAAEAIFALEAIGLSEPIEGSLSWTLAELIDIEPEVITPLEEVIEDLRTEIAERNALDVLFDTLEVVEEEIASGTPVEEIAKKISVPAQVIERINRDGLDGTGNAVEGIPDDPKFLEEVYSTVVGFEGDVLEMGKNTFVSVRVDEIIQDFVKPYDSVKAEVLASWRDIERENRLEALAASIAERGNAGEDFAALGDEIGRGVLSASAPIRRGEPGDFISAEVNRKLFLSQQGDFLYGAAGSGSGLMVVQVSDITVPNAVAAGEVIDSFQSQIAQQMEDDIFQLYLSGLVSQYGETRNQSAIDIALGVAPQTP